MKVPTEVRQAEAEYHAGNITAHELSKVRQKAYSDAPHRRIRLNSLTQSCKRLGSRDPETLTRLRRIYRKAKRRGLGHIKRTANRLGINYSTFVNIGNHR